MTPDHGLQAGLRPRRARAADAPGADGRQCGRGAAIGADRYAASAGHGRADSQPRAATVRAIAGRGDRVGDGADRDRASPKVSPIRRCTPRWKRCSTRLRRRPPRAGGGPRWFAMKSCCLRKWASGSIWPSARSPEPPIISSRSAPSPAGRSARRRRSPTPANFCRFRFVREGGEAAGAISSRVSISPAISSLATC